MIRSELRQVAIYVRVSSRQQDTQGQERDLQSWAEANSDGLPVHWYRDKCTGRTMDRPALNQLMEQVRLGRVAKIVVWRIDRLGRTASGLTALFDSLQQMNVSLVSLKDGIGIDLFTPAGRLLANVLASVAQFEMEVQNERRQAGIRAARAKGKRWGGRRPGQRWKVTDDQIAVVHKAYLEGMPKRRIARLIGVSTPTIYAILNSIPRSTTVPKVQQEQQ